MNDYRLALVGSATSNFMDAAVSRHRFESVGELAALSFEGLHFLGNLGRDTATLASINLDLLDPVVQRLPRTA